MTGSLYLAPGDTSGNLDVRRFYVDGPWWLAKAYYDPYVNFSDVDMFRLAVGAKF